MLSTKTMPVIALIGRPNVGKSTLFNVLTCSRNALVIDYPGLTRDRQYGEGEYQEQSYWVIDTGGIGGEEDPLYALVARQTEQALAEADAVFFLVDARAGLTTGDIEIANRVRRLNKLVFLVVNKTDGLDYHVALADFSRLGFAKIYPIAASQRHGTQRLIEKALEILRPESAVLPTDHEEEFETEAGGGGSQAIEDENGAEEDHEANDPGLEVIKIAVVGRPNVGKSTLVNRILGEKRVIVADLSGTTRDSIYIPFERHGRSWVLIDTAGVRKHARNGDAVEHYSIVKTLQAVDAAQVVILVMDARQGIAEQDAHLAGLILEKGRGLILAINKWDGLNPEQREISKEAITLQLAFANFAPLHTISALHGSGVGELLNKVEAIHAQMVAHFSTSLLTDILAHATKNQAPPQAGGRAIKLRYAHQGGSCPPLVVVHGNRVEHIPENYRRYLINVFRQALKIKGAPLKMIFKSGDNPYEGKTNTLTSRQASKRRRLMRFVKRR